MPICGWWLILLVGIFGGRRRQTCVIQGTKSQQPQQMLGPVQILQSLVVYFATRQSHMDQYLQNFSETVSLLASTTGVAL